jgi:hypothetical protein
MTQAITKTILLVLLTLAMLTEAASAEQRTFCDAGGTVVGRSAIDSSGTVTTAIAVARSSAARRRPAIRRRFTCPC